MKLPWTQSGWGMDPRMCGSYLCDPTTVAMALQTYANLRTTTCESLPAHVAPSPLSIVAPGGNSTAPGNGPAPAAAPVAAPTVLPSTTIPIQQQPGNAAVSSTTSKLAAPSFLLSSKPIQTSSRLSNKTLANYPNLFQLSLSPQQIKEKK